LDAAFKQGDPCSFWIIAGIISKFVNMKTQRQMFRKVQKEITGGDGIEELRFKVDSWKQYDAVAVRCNLADFHVEFPALELHEKRFTVGQTSYLYSTELSYCIQRAKGSSGSVSIHLTIFRNISIN